MLSEKALSGNYNFDIGRFIVSPFYNLYIAGHKLVFGNYWATALIATQLLISSYAGVCFYQLGRLLFNRKIAIVSTLIFGVYPLTLYWVHTFCAESLFQSLLIVSVYFLVKSAKTQAVLPLLISCVVFCVVFLTKSHILIFTPFIALYLYLNCAGKKKFLYPLIYAIVCLTSTLPFGLYNLEIHDQYVLSSNGSNFHFYTGNSEFGYRSIVDVPAQSSEEFKHLKNMNMSQFNGTIHDEIMKRPHKEKQAAYLAEATSWIKQNPMKFIKLKVYNLFLFLFPGVSMRHYSTLAWLFSFVVSLPIYIFGYMGLFRSLKSDFRTHSFSFGLFMSMVIFSVVWYVQNRFRVITIEPMYILYSGIIISSLLEKGKEKWRKKGLSRQ